MLRACWILLLLPVLLLGVFPQGASATSSEGPEMDVEPLRSATDRLYLHAHFNRSGLAVEGASPQSGMGFGTRLGFGFTNRFTLYSGLDMTFINTQDPFMQDLGGSQYALGHFDVGGQFNFRSGANRIVPYVDTSVSGKMLVYRVNGYKRSFRGTGLTVGAGIKYFLTPSLSLDTGVYGTASILDRREENDTIDRINMNAGTVRMNVGFSWYPGR